MWGRRIGKLCEANSLRLSCATLAFFMTVYVLGLLLLLFAGRQSFQRLSTGTQMWNSTITRADLRSSITRLQKYGKIIAKPEENVFKSVSESQHCLSKEREKEIASNLAFLSSTSDSPLEVRAVCIEEDHDGNGATIRLSSNSGDLSALTMDFRTIAETLEVAASRGSESEFSS